jgi:sialidase-1
MASLYRFKHLLFFSNPNSKEERRSMTIKVSRDYGNSWPGKYHIELYEGIGNGYSCLTSVDDLYIGILYESSQEQLVFQKIPISDFFCTD